ncbi:MAG: hypothetical protein WCJ31_16345 [Planctomycetia bacterium]
MATAEDTTVASADISRLPPCPSPRHHPFRALGWLFLVGTGLASLLLLLAILAAIPIVNLLALGTMLEAEGRVVRSGRLRDGIPFAGALPRLGGIVIGTWLWLLVIRFVTQASADAALIDPGGPSARGWALVRFAVSLLVGCHLLATWFSGGSLPSFFRPVRNGRRLLRALRVGTAWGTASAALAQIIDAVQPGRLFSLGLRGFVGTFLWLLLPTLLFSFLGDTTKPGQVLVTLLGGILLGTVLAWVPFLQARFAAEQRLAVFRDLGTVRELWRRAPVVMLLALVILYGLSLPLYLFKIVAAPRDAVLFLTPIFILTIYPARLAVGWATHRAQARPARAWLLLRWPVTALLLPLLTLYLFLLFFTPAIDAFGKRALFDHHALLIPTPF